MPNRVTSRFLPEVKKQNNNMLSTKRTNKNKASPQDNNTIVEACNKTNYSKAKQKTSTENVVQNIAEPLGKMASIRRGKKDKNEKNKDQSESDSDNDIKGNKQHNDDEANNTEDDHDNDDDDDNNKDDNDDDDDNNNGDKDDISQSGFSNGSTETKHTTTKTKINVVTLDYLQKTFCMKKS